jgi:hypothetical protein
MRVILFVFLAFSALILRGGELESSYKKALHKRPFHSIVGIDYIYVINAKKDLPLFRDLKKRFSKFEIVPYRFNAVEASNLTYKTLLNVGYRTRGAIDFEATEVTRCGKNTVFQTGVISDPKAVYFHKCMTLGAIARNLDFLSAIYDAYKAKYKVAWIMTDKIRILVDPNILTGYIVEIGDHDQRWDVLYTDMGSRDKNAKHFTDFVQPMRPDVEFNDAEYYLSRKKDEEDPSYIATRVGLRRGAESFLVSRSGMKKILDYYHRHRFFTPFDVEIQLIDGLRSYELSREVVTD